MNFSVFCSVGRNVLRRGYAKEMIHKLGLRARSKARGERREESVAWARSRAESLDEFARSLDAELWETSQRFGADLQAHAERRLSEVGEAFGGGGDYRLLYFLVRHLRPQVVVETGVAAGFSSAAILQAMAECGTGQLYSSDFPYVRLHDPEKHIGCVVEEELRDRWKLRTQGDRVNLPAFANELSRIDMMHYDSDKSYEGRELALAVLGPKFSKSTIIVFDDIQDNFHFRDWIVTQEHTARVFEFGGKWVGLVGI